MKFIRIREASTLPCASPKEIYESMQDEAVIDRECMWVLHLNTKLLLIEKELVSMGILDQSMVHPREVFKRAIVNSASSIITVHNHPSGSLIPSKEDKIAWKQLRDAGEILKIPVLDNLIISSDGFYSETERGRL